MMMFSIRYLIPEVIFASLCMNINKIEKDIFIVIIIVCIYIPYYLTWLEHYCYIKS